MHFLNSFVGKAKNGKRTRLIALLLLTFSVLAINVLTYHSPLFLFAINLTFLTVVSSTANVNVFIP